MNQPSPLQIDHSNDISPPPNSWSSHHSNDVLMGNPSPPYGPPVPRHGSPQQNGSGLSNLPSRLQRPQASADSGLRRNSAIAVRRQSTLEYVDTADENAQLLKEAISATRFLSADPGEARVRDSWLPRLSSSPSPLEGPRKTEKAESSFPVPRADTPSQDDNMFDHQITAAADLAHQYQQRSNSPPRVRTPPKNKVMTPQQFERYKQDQERYKSLGGAEKDEDNDDITYEDDDEDEAEKQRQIAKQRRKQEAHMAVYRQQMMKVTGESSSAAGPSRISMVHSRSSPNLPTLAANAADDEEEEDEEVPLAILQAHGFPSKNRPPTQLSYRGSNPNLRASSVMGGGQPTGPQHGRLPAFARKLPDDPYFGAGLVNPINRESLAYGTGAGSVYGGSTRGAPPGGLVNVIANEERARAMRRGSPNAAGEYGPPPANGFNGMGMGMPPNMSMPPTVMGPMGPMLTPGDHAQLEMAQQMQQFMQMQMQFMQMMTSNQGRPQSQNGQPPQLPSMASMPMMSNMGQPSPQGLRPGSSTQRAMSMLDPNAIPWQQQNPNRNTMYTPSIQIGGYTPSIAPSERSNVGLPGRYRPVSHYPGADNKSTRTASMSGALQNWDQEKQGPTVKVVKKSANVDDEDDEEGWEAMKKKREKKKSIWKSKKDDNGMKDLWGFANN
jgi:hypothetical protein